MRIKNWPAALLQSLERLRQDYSMCGRAKLGTLLREQGFKFRTPPSDASSQAWVERGVVVPGAKNFDGAVIRTSAAPNAVCNTAAA